MIGAINKQQQKLTIFMRLQVTPILLADVTMTVMQSHKEVLHLRAKGELV